MDKSNDVDTKERYTIETENKFEVLLKVADENQTPEELLKYVNEVYLTAADEVLGKRRKKKSKPWISSETLEITEKKRNARKNGNRMEYVRLKAEVQKCIRSDKRKWLEEQCAKIDEFDRKHQSKAFYKQIKATNSRKFHTSQLPIKDKNKNTLTDKNKIMQRWKEYGEDLFCLPDGDTLPDPRHPHLPLLISRQNPHPSLVK